MKEGMEPSCGSCSGGHEEGKVTCSCVCHGLKTRSKYQAVWKPNSLNEPFWREVLEGRKIVRIDFDEHGISALHLDSGETVFLPVELKGGRLMIRD